MTSFRLPSSKYRHVFCTTAKRENCYEGFRLSKSSCDNPLCATNPKFLAYAIDCGGGGAFQVIPNTKMGRLNATYPRFDAHSGDILDIQFNPFNDNQIATCSDDTLIKIWDIPEEMDKEDTGEMNRSVGAAQMELQGHQKKVQTIEWHPSASNVLLSAGGDNLIIIWNTLDGVEVFQIEHPDQVFCASWTWDGKYFATSCKDLFIRIYDPRNEENPLVRQSATIAHEGKKQMQIKCIKDNKLVTTGFGRSSDRQYSLWDIDNLNAPLMSDELDQTSGVLFIIYDADSNMIYFVGRGDTTIRFYEVKDTKLNYLSLQTYQEPHKGVAVMPKRALNISTNEIMRFFRVLPNKNIIEPCTWTVPRKSDMFQADLYPDTLSNVPSLEADEWLDGRNEEPNLVPIQTMIESAANIAEQKPKQTRAEMIAARATARAVEAADKAMGSKTAAPKSSRYEAEKAAAGLTNGNSAAAETPQTSVDTARLLDEIKKLTLVVKAHEARIKQLEATVAVNTQEPMDGVNGN
jgi:hypothetical protein